MCLIFFSFFAFSLVIIATIIRVLSSPVYVHLNLDHCLDNQLSTQLKQASMQIPNRVAQYHAVSDQMIIDSTIERCILQTTGSQHHLLHHQTGQPILPAASASHILRAVSHQTGEPILPAASVSCTVSHLLHALRVISLPQARPTDSQHRLD